ncbi:MAG TPA: DNA ligase D [Puia sp.]|jgi:bifunctional non-homologous end joining protein LigD|nr:DNA ligase D [Puia sp.]
MALKEYRKKRSFTDTPEPQGGHPDSKTLRFVVQKHAASRLHYDFRLEMDGVLKSWAIPKGPSLNPADKRLAMQVEDHPFAYKDFEGIIPAGNYGAGTVMVWDEGTYEPLGATDGTKAARQSALLKELRAGSLKFRLNGKKLKGEFALVRTKGRGENSWLLIKHRDRYATETPVTDKDRSVRSRKTLEQIAKSPNSAQWSSNRKTTSAKSTSSKSSTAKSITSKPTATKSTSKPSTSKTTSKPSTSKTRTSTPTVSIPASAPKKPIPKDLSPMLATLVDQPFDDKGWSYEIKWDGYRALAYLQKGKVELRSRNNKSFEKYYPIYDALKSWPVSAVLDGEIVVLNDKGQSDFGDLQNWRSEADGDIVYYVFDLPWLKGRDLTGLPLSERRTLLQSIVPPEGIVRYSESFETGGKEFFAKAQQLGLEGIMAKRTDSHYTSGTRTRDWLKIKTASRQEVVIGGFSRNEDSPRLFSALLVGVFENGRLRYTGKVGTGFTEQMQRDMMKRFKPLIQKKSPFITEPDVNQPSRFRPDPPAATATWLKPVLVGEVAFREMTTDGLMRQPSFQGMREDKDAKDVVLEKPVHVPEKPVPAKSRTSASSQVPAKSRLARKQAVANKIITPVVAKGERGTLLNPGDETQTRKIDGHDLSFTHLSKIFWPKEKYTKRDLLNYYYQVAPYMLPWLKDRPQSLNRHPNGITGPSFYQKNVSGKVPDWITTFPYHSADDNEDKEFLVCTDEASLLYMVSLGCIELNPWSSRVATPENPDWCIIDLDPDKKTPFEKVIEAALVTRKILEAAGVTSYCKTSGSTGLHIYFPLGAKYPYENSKEFARVIVQHVHNEIPDFTTVERMTSQRKGRMYLDFLQNRPQATIAAPYSVRPKPGATVSAPLHWKEVKKGMTTQDFTMKNMPARVKEMGDLFKPVLGKGIDMEKALKKLNAL